MFATDTFMPTFSACRWVQHSLKPYTASFKLVGGTNKALLQHYRQPMFQQSLPCSALTRLISTAWIATEAQQQNLLSEAAAAATAARHAHKGCDGRAVLVMGVVGNAMSNKPNKHHSV